MKKIFFKTLWNSRRRNVLILLELFIISLVLVNLTVYLTDMIRIMNIKNCYDSHDVVYLGLAPIQREDAAKSKQSLNNLKTKLLSNQYVEAVSYPSRGVPYTYNLSTSGFKVGDEEIILATNAVDIDYAKVMKIHPLKGRWFDDTDRGKKVKPIVVTNSVEMKHFGGNAVGKIFGEEEKYEIVGVVDEFKRSDVEKPYLTAFFFKEDFPKHFWWETVLVRVKPGQVENFLRVAEPEVLAVMDPAFWSLESQNSLENMRDVQNYESSQRRYIALLMALFIMINVLLGVIGILWYNTNLRVHEIGIKRALGASGMKIRRLLIFENLFLGGIGLVIVALVFIQVPAIRLTKVEPPVMYLSVLISVGVMILLILLSTWIPSALASKIRPAEALKTE